MHERNISHYKRISVYHSDSLCSSPFERICASFLALIGIGSLIGSLIMAIRSSDADDDLQKVSLIVGSIVSGLVGFYLTICCGACTTPMLIRDYPTQSQLRAETRALENLLSNNPFEVDEATVIDVDDSDTELDDKTPLLFGRR